MKKIFIIVLFMFQGLFAEDIYATFDVVSEKKSELGLSASGIVTTLNVNVGDKIKKGDLLLSLNNTQEKNEYETARKNAEETPAATAGSQPWRPTRASSPGSGMVAACITRNSAISQLSIGRIAPATSS